MTTGKFRPGFRSSGNLIALVALLASHWGFGAGASLHAAPHTVSQIDPAMDPNWPDVYLILVTKCASCHNGNTDISELTSYEALMAARSADNEPIVAPGRPDDSTLWQVVVWNVDAAADSDLPDAPQMPEVHRDWLTRGQLATIRQWIADGARQYVRPPCGPHVPNELDYPSARQCKACHPRQYEQWARSMHHYGQHSPIFEAFNLTLQERTGGTLGTFCTRCHTPVGTALGENGQRRNVHRSRISMEGVTCVVCHRQRRPNYKSSGRLPLEPGKLLDTCMFGPFDDPVDHNQTNSHPSVGVPHLKTSAFCGQCHDVTNPQGVRLEEAYSEWQNSPAAAEGITCHRCHMGPMPGVPVPEDHRPLGRAATVEGVDPALIPLRRLSDHTFAGPDYSMLPDTEFPEKLDWMYETDYRDQQRLTPYQQKSLVDLRRHNRRQLQLADEARYQLLANAARIAVRAPQRVACGEKLRLRVDVTSTTLGHGFPTGFTAERQAWVEVTLRDPDGRPVYRSGDLDENGDLRDAHSHAVEAGTLRADHHLLNFQNKFIALAREGSDRTVVLSVNRFLQPVNVVRPATGISASFGRPFTFRIAKGSLPPGKTIGRNYMIRLPATPGDYFLNVRLNFRHLPPALLDAIGSAHRKHLLEIVVIDEYQQIIRVGQNL